MVDPGFVIFENQGLKLNNKDDVNDITDMINKCDNLYSFTLTGNSLGVEAAKSIAKSLETKSTLKCIYMSDIFTGRDKYEIPQALEYIFDAILLSKAKIEVLDLSDNAFGPHGMKALTNFLSNASYLKILVLNNNGLGSFGSRLMSDALIECNQNQPLKLIELYCGRNRLEDEGAKNISQLISCINTLEILKIPQNGIQHKGINDLCLSLIKNPLLKSLDLNDNILTEIGAKALSNFIEKLENLHELDLGDCLLRDNGGIYLSTALKSTQSPINKLNITYNELGHNTITSIIDAISEKKYSFSLSLDGNMIGKRGRTSVSTNLRKYNFISFDGFDNDESTDDSDDNVSDEMPLDSQFSKMEIK